MMSGEGFWSLLVLVATFWLGWFLFVGMYRAAESRWEADRAERLELREWQPRHPSHNLNLPETYCLRGWKEHCE